MSGFVQFPDLRKVQVPRPKRGGLFWMYVCVCVCVWWWGGVVPSVLQLKGLHSFHVSFVCRQSWRETKLCDPTPPHRANTIAAQVGIR